VKSGGCGSFVVAKQEWRHKMWTEIPREKYERGNSRYASDLMDGEWDLIEPFLPLPGSIGRPSNGGFARGGGEDFRLAWTMPPSRQGLRGDHRKRHCPKHQRQHTSHHEAVGKGLKSNELF
jgi:hypothetical protein